MSIHNPRGRRDVFSDGKVHLCASKCETCVFRPGNLMHLRPGRLKSMVDESVEAGAAITCHETMFEEGHAQQAICRGFWDAHADRVQLLTVADRIGIVQEVEVS